MSQMEEKIRKVLQQYIDDEELYDDDTLLVINPVDKEVVLAGGDSEPDESEDSYYVMDLLSMGTDGHWTPDPGAIAEVAAQYED